MRKISKIIPILLVAVFLFSALSACKVNEIIDPSKNEIFDDFYAGIDFDSQIGYFVKNNLSDYTILIPEKAEPTDIQAADELYEYTRLSTGVQLKTTSDKEYNPSGRYFSIGKTKLLITAKLGTDHSSLNGDGFVIKTVNNSIVVDAGTNRGFLYGTYDFIEKIIGVRFIAEDETYIPKATEIPVYEMDILSIPAFKMRVYLNSPTFLMYTDMEYIAHSRTVYDWLDIPENYGGSANSSKRGNNTHNARFYVPADKYGTREIGYSGEFLTVEEGYDPHPELWYIKPEATEPMYEPGGEGSGITLNWLNGITESGELDTTMEVSTAKVVIEEMKKDALANPNAEFFILDQEDNGTIMPSDDPTVKKYTAAGVLVRFCNVVAKELQKWANEELNGRKINIVTFAYQQTQPAPVKVEENGEIKPIDKTVVPVDNLYIRLAFTSAMYYPYDDERQPDVVKQTVTRWRSICKNFWFWGYDAVYTDYISYSPTLGQAYGTVQHLKDIGTEYVLMQSTHNNPNDWQAYLKGYVWNKLMWNPNQDVTRLINEYLIGYYGPASVYVKQMMDLFDAHFGTYMAKEDPEIWFWAYGTIGNEKTLTSQLLDKAIEIMVQGEAVIKTDVSLSEETKDKLLKRMAQVKLTPQWMKLSYFSTLYPLMEDRNKKILANEILSQSIYSGVKMLSEGTGLIGYLSLIYGVS